jgi:carboxymethylenebutenolidase
MTAAMSAETVTITGHGGDQIEAYLARPLDSDRHGGVVVIHHMPGYDVATKEIVRRFAAEGYRALCPNLYSRDAPGADPDDAAATVRAAGGCQTSGWSATWGVPQNTSRVWAAPTARLV